MITIKKTPNENSRFRDEIEMTLKTDDDPSEIVEFMQRFMAAIGISAIGVPEKEEEEEDYSPVGISPMDIEEEEEEDED